MKFTKLATLLAMTAVLAGCSSMNSSEVGSSNVEVAGMTDNESAYGETRGVTLPKATGAELQKELISTAGADRVFFEFDSASIDADSQAYLRQAADYIRSSGVRTVTVEGHCDERGTREYNLALGDRRAVAVKRFLVGLGVSPRNIVTVSYGKERPEDNGHVEASWAKNRRAVLVFN